MNDRIPLGEKEGPCLEFKGADALKEPEKIAREAVAMLNADGGKVWIGLREEGGRAVALEPIADPEGEERRLLDFLVDTIEPSVSDKEIEVGSLSEKDEFVLRVTVAPNSTRRPYAFLRKGGRHFVIRVGDRVRPMVREEIFSRPPATEARDLELAQVKIFEDKKRVLMEARELLWLRLQPARDLDLDIKDAKYVDLLQNPRSTKNRSTGWNFAHFWHRPKVEGERLKTDPQDLRSAEIWKDGGLAFTASLRALTWGPERGTIRPLVLLEYVVSGLRIARATYESLEPQDLILGDLSLVGLKDWSLAAEGGASWKTRSPGKDAIVDDLVRVQPLAFRFEEIFTEPDRCGYRLVEPVFEAFGLTLEEIPREYDQKAGRLILPE